MLKYGSSSRQSMYGDVRVSMKGQQLTSMVKAFRMQVMKRDSLDIIEAACLISRNMTATSSSEVTVDGGSLHCDSFASILVARSASFSAVGQSIKA
jgi:hypothetical protein